ncbi:hypothetical protein A4G20_05180 [Pasteurellaceae bacterium RH1A]|nr:hypothetical protein A4G20_05180 [Pasteurellaceae bacterium RH1A]
MKISSFEKELRKVISDVSCIIGEEIPQDCYQINILSAPHKPNNLPENKMGIYIFKYQNDYLKIGKVGAKSNARFVSQHYLPNSAMSNLAKSLLSDGTFGVNEENVGDWIRNNCDRIEIIIDAELGDLALSLIEASLHYKYKPRYEGKNKETEAS